MQDKNKRLTYSVVESDQDAVRARVQISGLSASVPSFFPIIRKAREFDIVLNSSATSSVGGIVVPLYVAPDIMGWHRAESLQTDLFGNSKDPRYKLFENSKLVLMDPCLEQLHFNRKDKDFSEFIDSIGDKFVRPFLRATASKRSKAALDELIRLKETQPKEFIKLISLFIDQMDLAKSSAILPPSNLIDGNLPASYDLSKEINVKTAELARAHERPVLYNLNLNMTAFGNNALMQTIIQDILDGDILKDVDGIYIKLTNPSFEDKTIYRNRIKALLHAVRARKSLGDFMVVLSNVPVALGYATLTLGVDVFCTALTGFMQIASTGGKPGKGGYFHKELLEWWPYEEIKNYVSINGVLPCDGQLCLGVNKTNLHKMDDRTWNEFRRAHTLEAVNKTMDELHSAITSGTASGGIVDRISRSGQKCYLEILTNSQI